MASRAQVIPLMGANLVGLHWKINMYSKGKGKAYKLKKKKHFAIGAYTFIDLNFRGGN